MGGREAQMRSPLDLTVTGLTYLSLAAIGVLLAAVEAFLVPERLVGGAEGLSVLIAVVANPAVGLLGGFGTSSQAGAVVPAAGWFAAMVALSIFLPGGDVVIPGRLPSDPGVVTVGWLTLLGGLVSSIVPIPLANRYTRRVNAPKGFP